MITKQIALPAILLLTACRSDEGLPPPVYNPTFESEGSDGSSGASGGSAGSAADTTGGPIVCEYYEYQCKMKRIGAYTTGTGGVEVTNPQPSNYGQGETFDCHTFTVVAPDSDPDSQVIKDACMAACEDPTAWGFQPIADGGAGSTAIHLQHSECAWQGTLTLPGVGGNEAQCAGETGANLRVKVEPASGDQCVVPITAPCTEWDPTLFITHSVSGRTHTVTFDGGFRDDLLGDAMNDYYVCDPGRYQQGFVIGGPETWTIADASAGSLFSAMGLVNGDTDFKVAHQRGATWYPLNSFAAISAAYDEMAGDDTLYLSFKRSGLVHTINLTFN